MTMTSRFFTMRQYQHLIEALATQSRLGFSNADDAARAIRHVLIAEHGVRQLLATRLNAHAGEPAADWTVEYEYGQQQIQLKEPGKTLLDALVALVEEPYERQGVWPTGVHKEEDFIVL